MKRPTNREKLAYHEAGHLIMSSLIRKLNPVVEVKIALGFPTPRGIEINEEKDGGQVIGCGFPIEDWEPEKLYTVRRTWPKRSTFYRSNKIFALCNAMIALAGHVFEVAYNRPEERKITRLGNHVGELGDKGKFDRLVGFLMNNHYESTEDRSYQEEALGILESLTNDIHHLTERDEVREATMTVRNRLLSANTAEDGTLRLEEEDFQKLLEIIQDLLSPVSIDFIVEKYSS